ncbi:hypothetical protein ACFV6Z_12715 [Streptomyces sp. NPDC059818]|uniref:hypothetical protein n=1 Tax=Streptomyces sp. NPDC059818 TaxID=3346962 RepID=UPI0036639F54
MLTFTWPAGGREEAGEEDGDEDGDESEGGVAGADELPPPPPPLSEQPVRAVRQTEKAAAATADRVRPVRNENGMASPGSVGRTGRDQ